MAPRFRPLIAKSEPFPCGSEPAFKSGLARSRLDEMDVERCLSVALA